MKPTRLEHKAACFPINHVFDFHIPISPSSIAPCYTTTLLTVTLLLAFIDVWRVGVYDTTNDTSKLNLCRFRKKESQLEETQESLPGATHSKKITVAGRGPSEHPLS